MKTETQPHTDPQLSQAVDNIQSRFLQRVGDRVALGIRQRELSEELIIESLQLTQSRYGCVLRVTDSATQSANLLELDAVISLTGSNSVSRQHDTLLNRSADSFVELVIASAKPTFSNHIEQGVPSCLPSCHPTIESFAVFPIRRDDQVLSVLFMANSVERFDLVTINRLQAVLDSFVHVDITTIVNHGIHRVIDDIKRTSIQLITLVSASINGIITIDEQGLICAFNPASEKLFNVPALMALGKSMATYLNKPELAQLLSNAREFRRSMRPKESAAVHTHKISAFKSNGAEFQIDLVTYHSRVDQKIFTTLIVNDISDRMDSAQELQDTVLQFKTLTKLAPVGILQLDADFTCVYANDMWCDLSGLSIKETINSGWIDAIHADDRVAGLTDMRTVLDSNSIFQRELRLNVAAQAETWIKLSATGMHNQQNELSGSLVVVMDITETQRARARLKHIAHHDALTGLLNRARFLERLNDALCESELHGDVGLLFIDLDGFKLVNDSLGHDYGDELLKQVAVRLQKTMRDEDTIARLGGDEFTIVITHLTDQSAIAIVAEKIVDQIRAPFNVMGQEVLISASLGIAVGNSDCTDSDVLIKQADIALYKAKESGRSRYVFFTSELEQARHNRSLLITSLRRAVDRQAFELYYQPQLHIREQKLLGFEALLRWPQASGEYIKPLDFIDVLEETGMINEVGQWAIKEACTQYMAWRNQGLIAKNTTMSVNVSARQLGLPHFASLVQSILDSINMPANRLILEITESVLVHNIESSIINEIKALGIQISLDDFGTGFSSLAYLSQLPIDHLKIDRSFISNIHRQSNAVTIVKSIIALARTLGIEVIAEGVEDPYVLPLLEAEGCIAYQGFHFSEPLPATGIESLIISLDEIALGHLVNFINLDDARPMLVDV